MFPEITLRAAGVGPPTRADETPLSDTPVKFPTAAVPAAFVPMKLPSTIDPGPALIAVPEPKWLTARPRTTEPVETVRSSPIAVPESAAPLSSICSVASEPTAKVLADDPAWE